MKFEIEHKEFERAVEPLKSTGSAKTRPRILSMADHARRLRRIVERMIDHVADPALVAEAVEEMRKWNRV